MTDLFDTTTHVRNTGPAYGWRLRPGCEVDGVALLGALEQTHPDDPRVVEVLGENVSISPRVMASLDAIGAHSTVASAARSLGISSRTLQRVITGPSGRSPRYWLQLARVRMCAQALPNGAPLCELAFRFHYADQAHMTRDFRRWYGTTPARFRASPSLLLLVGAQGYDGTIGEQISTKNPLGSDT